MKSLIIVEGGDDQTFLQALLKHEYKFEKKKEIKDKLGIKFLRLSTNFTGLEKYKSEIRTDINENPDLCIAIILDSDVNPKEKVEQEWQDLGFTIQPKIHLIENCLEFLILKSIEDESPVKKMMHKHFENLNNNIYQNCSENWRHFDKKQLAVYLASIKLEKFAKDLNCIDRGEFIDLNHDVFNELKNFLQEFVA
jgi:hypothetical protein